VRAGAPADTPTSTHAVVATAGPVIFKVLRLLMASNYLE
jgi:hypothetical protein